MQYFIQNVRLFNIFRDTVMLRRKSVVLLPVYAVVRTRTSSGSYQNRYGANDWSRHDKHLNSQSIFGLIFLLLTPLRGRQPNFNFLPPTEKKIVPAPLSESPNILRFLISLRLCDGL